MRAIGSRGALLVAVTILLTACMAGEGPVTTETRSVRAFDGIEIGSGIRLSMRIGPEHAVEVSAQENLLGVIGIEVRGSTLVIDAREDYTSTEPVTVTVLAPALAVLSMSGGARAEVDGLAASDMTLDLRGGATAMLAGSVDRLDLKADGGAVAELEDLAVRTISLTVEGGAAATVNASVEVTGSASGGSSLTVLGDAEVTVDTSGGANVARE